MSCSCCDIKRRLEIIKAKQKAMDAERTLIENKTEQPVLEEKPAKPVASISKKKAKKIEPEIEEPVVVSEDEMGPQE